MKREAEASVEGRIRYASWAPRQKAPNDVLYLQEIGSRSERTQIS